MKIIALLMVLIGPCGIGAGIASLVWESTLRNQAAAMDRLLKADADLKRSAAELEKQDASLKAAERELEDANAKLQSSCDALEREMDEMEAHFGLRRAR